MDSLDFMRDHPKYHDRIEAGATIVHWASHLLDAYKGNQEARDEVIVALVSTLAHYQIWTPDQADFHFNIFAALVGQINADHVSSSYPVPYLPEIKDHN